MQMKNDKMNYYLKKFFLKSFRKTILKIKTQEKSRVHKKKISNSHLLEAI